MSTQIPLEHEISKSRVRINVTYLMSATYALGALTLIVWLMVCGEQDLALGLFSGVASTTATITAFWFGSRGSARSKLDEAEVPQNDLPDDPAPAEDPE